MARRHRMTPRRRAALKKAQAASARKRRKRAFVGVAKGVGTVAVGVGATFATYHMNRYIAYPNQGAREIGGAIRGVGRTGARVTGLEKRARVNTIRRHRAQATANVLRRRATKSAKPQWHKFGYL